MPRELDKVTLPDYIIEPPDVLTISAVNLVPKAPYRLNAFDAINLAVELPDPEIPIATTLRVQPNGTVRIGYGFGSAQVGGLTLDEAEQLIREQIETIYREPEVWITLESISSQQEIAGEHLVSADGKVNLGSYGRVRVVGMTPEEATDAINLHLSEFLEDAKISLDVFGYNSKSYYVITQGAGLGDRVISLPFRGNETVLDAIGEVEGLTSVSSTTMWLARPALACRDGIQIMPVDWRGITQNGDTTTNYQVLPGDRIYIAQDGLVAMDNRLGKIISPLERIFGVTLLATQTVQRLVFFDRFSANVNAGNNF